jgi:site-specific DNA-methyltransferase (adenine-specific)
MLTDPEEIVLDCFVGSGTTAAAAIIESRNYIGIDKEKKYVQLANQTCNNAFNNKIAIENNRPILKPIFHQLQLV